MSNALHKRPQIRRRCRKCHSMLVNKPEYGAVCPKCGWYRRSYTDKELKEGDQDAKKLQSDS